MFNYLFFVVTEAILANFENENITYATIRYVVTLSKALEDDCEVARKWFSVNEIIFNPAKFQFDRVHRRARFKNQYSLDINDTNIVVKSPASFLRTETVVILMTCLFHYL